MNAQKLMDDFLATHKYDKTPGNWREMPSTDPDNVADDDDLAKEWTQSASATSGITDYGSTKERRKKRRVKLLPTKEN